MRRYGRILGGIVGVVIALGACGGKPFSKAVGPEAVRAHLVAAASRTVDAKTARLAISVRISGGGVVGDFKETGTGVLDFNSGALDLTASFDAGGSSAKLEARRVDKTLYVRTSGYPGAADSWESVDLSKVEGSEAAVNAQFAPAEFLTYLNGVADDVRVVGTEKLRGDDTTHYAASVTLERALAATSLSTDDRQTLQRAKKVFTGTMPIEAWIDDSGRLRKLTMTLHENANLVEDTSAPTIATTLEYYDFGTAVVVSKPSNSADVQGRAQDRATQSDLRNALTAEKTYYTDSQAYTDDIKSLKDIESSLDWGGKLKVFVGDADVSDQTVCMEETSDSGTVFSIADVAEGNRAGTYFGNGKCPATPTPESLAALGSSWNESSSSSGSSDTPDESAPAAPHSATNETLTPGTISTDSLCKVGTLLVNAAVDEYRRLAKDDTLEPTLDQLVAFKLLPEKPTAIQLTYAGGKPNVVCK